MVEQPTVAESDVLLKALAQVGESDFTGAAQTIAAVGAEPVRSRLAAQLVQGVAERDPRMSAAVAAALPTSAARTGGVEIAAHAFVKRNPDEAVRWAHDLTGSSIAGVGRRVVTEDLVRGDPRATVGRVLGLPADTVREDMLGFTAAAWARQDPAAAVAWLRTLPDDERKQRLTSTIGFEVAQRDPARAITLAEMLPAGRDRWLLFGAITQTWVATDPKAALAWAGSLPAGESRDAAFAGVDTGLGVPSSRRVASAPVMRGGNSRSSSQVSIPEWPEVTSPLFAAWLATQRPGMSRDEAILEYVRQRGSLDAGSIGDWVAHLPMGPARDQAMEIYLEGQLIGSPQRAASWLRTVPRSDRTDDMIEKTARAWLQTNPDAAAAWLFETPLLPERKERLLREAGR